MREAAWILGLACLACSTAGRAAEAPDGDRAPVLVCGESGKGRYVACGLALGVDPNDAERVPRGSELRLLLNAIHWLGASQTVASRR